VATRSYQQFCGLARALDLVGSRWMLLIVRNLLLGPRRYSTLLEELPGITTNLLADRLKALAAAGLARRVEVDGSAAWALTAQGLLLEPVIMELARFGATTMTSPRRGERVDIGWALLSMKRRYRGGGDLVVELRVHSGARPRTFTLTLLPTYLRVEERAAVAPDLVLSADVQVLRGLLFAGASVADARASGGLSVAGHDDDVAAFFGAFAATPLPGTGGPDPDAVAAALSPPEDAAARRRSRSTARAAAAGSAGGTAAGDRVPRRTTRAGRSPSSP